MLKQVLTYDPVPKKKLEPSDHPAALFPNNSKHISVLWCPLPTQSYSRGVHGPCWAYTRRNQACRRSQRLLVSQTLLGRIWIFLKTQLYRQYLKDFKNSVKSVRVGP